MNTKTKLLTGIGIGIVVIAAVVFGSSQLYTGRLTVPSRFVAQRIVQPSWAWKLAPDPQDAYDFINGFGAYDEPHAIGGLTANDRGFYIFYREDLRGTSNWAWKLARDIDDVYDFISGRGAYTDPVKEARVAVFGGNFYVFYRR